MQPTTPTLIVAALGIAGTLSGVILGHTMLRLWQHEQWVRDERLKEFRELLSALSESYRLELDNLRLLHIGEERLAYIDSLPSVIQVVRSRIFIAREIQAINFEVRWTEAVHAFHNGSGIAALAGTCTDLQIAIMNAALRAGEPRKRTNAPRSG